MTGIVRSIGRRISGPSAAASTAAQEQQMSRQEQQIAKQEQQLTAERTDLAERTMASIRARRRGGLRALLSAERPDELGVMTSKLGGGS